MEDLNNIKEFDAPNETAYRNQASVSEGEIFTAGRSLASKTSVDAGAAAKTVPTGKPSAKTQALSIASQKTDAQPPSSVLATAQSKHHSFVVLLLVLLAILVPILVFVP